MPGIDHKYYKKGFGEQKRADITVSFKRPNIKDIKSWSDEEKKGVIDYIETSQQYFKKFCEALKVGSTELFLD